MSSLSSDTNSSRFAVPPVDVESVKRYKLSSRFAVPPNVDVESVESLDIVFLLEDSQFLLVISVDVCRVCQR